MIQRVIIKPEWLQVPLVSNARFLVASSESVSMRGMKKIQVVGMLFEKKQLILGFEPNYLRIGNLFNYPRGNTDSTFERYSFY